MSAPSSRDDAAASSSSPAAASAFSFQALLPPTSRLRSFPLPLLCALSCALLFLSFVFLPSLSSWVLALLTSAVRLAVACVVALLALLWWTQSSLLYMPSFMGRHASARSPALNSPGFRSPSEYGLPFTSHLIACPDGTLLHAWLLLHPSSLLHPTLLFLHGNAGNIGFRLPNARTLYHVCGLNVLLLEYRGFGDSAGTPSEEGLAMDGDAALQWLRQQRHVVDADNLFVFGRSLGGAVAVRLASRHSALLRGLVLENTFTSVDDMVVTLAQRVVRLRPLAVRVLRLALRLFMTSHWDSARRVALVGHCRALLISGDADELVPPWQMRRLHELMGAERADFLSIKGGQHNTTFVDGGTDYWTQLRSFIQRHQKQSSAQQQQQQQQPTPSAPPQQQPPPPDAANHGVPSTAQL